MIKKKKYIVLLKNTETSSLYDLEKHLIEEGEWYIFHQISGMYDNIDDAIELCVRFYDSFPSDPLDKKWIYIIYSYKRKGKKFCLDKELTPNEMKTYISKNIDKYIKVNNKWMKMCGVRMGLNLDIFINDEDPDIRKCVARQKYGLDILVNDKNFKVRSAVAEQGYGLDILVNDENLEVRRVVAYSRIRYL